MLDLLFHFFTHPLLKSKKESALPQAAGQICVAECRRDVHAATNRRRDCRRMKKLAQFSVMAPELELLYTDTLGIIIAPSVSRPLSTRIIDKAT